MPNKEPENDEWDVWWDARQSALGRVLGPADEMIGHATVPLELGGAADIFYFHQHLPGTVATTCNLIGSNDQQPNEMGTYELMICHRNDDKAGPSIISQLAGYTLQTALQPRQTMDIQAVAPQDSTITAFLFVEYARFQVRNKNAGLLLCIGITADELNCCKKGQSDEILSKLKDEGIFPYTEWARLSVNIPSFWRTLLSPR